MFDFVIAGLDPSDSSTPHSEYAMSSLESAQQQLDVGHNAAAAARQAVLDSLQAENSYLSQQLNSLQLQVDAWQPRRKPDCAQLYTTLRQLHDFPHDVLQPKEDLVYRHLMERDADDAPAFAGIRDQHQSIHALSGRLLQQLSDISHAGKPPRRDRLRPRLQRFIDTFREHIAAEENDVFPTAEKQLLESDWYALQSGISYLESAHSEATFGVAETGFQPDAAHDPSVTQFPPDRTEGEAASFLMAPRRASYSIAETVVSLRECAEQLTRLGIKQTTAGINASLDDIMACRDTSRGVAELPGKLIRTTLHNVGNTWREARQIVTENWRHEQPASARVGLLQDTRRDGQPLRSRH